jgi:hypothetical protein
MLDFKFTLLKYDINNTRSVGLAVYNRKVGFMNSTQNPLFYVDFSILSFTNINADFM